MKDFCSWNVGRVGFLEDVIHWATYLVTRTNSVLLSMSRRITVAFRQLDGLPHGHVPTGT